MRYKSIITGIALTAAAIPFYFLPLPQKRLGCFCPVKKMNGTRSSPNQVHAMTRKMYSVLKVMYCMQAARNSVILQLKRSMAIFISP